MISRFTRTVLVEKFLQSDIHHGRSRLGLHMTQEFEQLARFRSNVGYPSVVFILSGGNNYPSGLDCTSILLCTNKWHFHSHLVVPTGFNESGVCVSSFLHVLPSDSNNVVHVAIQNFLRKRLQQIQLGELWITQKRNPRVDLFAADPTGWMVQQIHQKPKERCKGLEPFPLALHLCVGS